MGSAVWPQQDVQAQNDLQNLAAQDVAPQLVPLQPAPVAPIGPVVEIQEHEPVEELVQVLPEQVDEPIPSKPEEVLVTDVNPDALEDEAIPLQPLLASDVQVVHFINLQNPQDFDVEEVPIENLVAFDDLQSLAQPAQELNNEVQAGFVEIFSPPVDHVL
jgi:hypothetical protein